MCFILSLFTVQFVICLRGFTDYLVSFGRIGSPPEVLESIHWFPCAHSGGFGEDMAVR